MPDSTDSTQGHQYETFLRQLPEDWGKKRIDEIGIVVNGGTPARGVPSYEITHRLNAAAQHINQETRFLTKLNKEKTALMDDLLTGRIRVTPLLDTTP